MQLCPQHPCIAVVHRSSAAKDAAQDDKRLLSRKQEDRTLRSIHAYASGAERRQQVDH